MQAANTPPKNNPTPTDARQGAVGFMKYAMGCLRNLLFDIILVKAQPDSKSTVMPLTRDTHSSINVRFTAAAIAILFAALMVAYHFWNIQFNEYDMHIAQARKYLGLSQRLIGTRGEIYDYDGNLLVGNIRTRDLYVTPRLVVGLRDENKEMMAPFCQFLAPLIGTDPGTLAHKLQEILDRKPCITVKENVSSDKANAIWRMNLPGVNVTSAKQPDGKGARTITLTPGNIDDLEVLNVVIDILNDRLKLEEGFLVQKAEAILRRQTPLLVMKNVPLEQSDALKDAFNAWRNIKDAKGKRPNRRVSFYAMHFEDSTVRYYPKQRLLANLLGFCDSDENGLSGIERLMNDELKRTCTSQYLMLDGKLSRVNYPRAIYSEANNGATVHLTIQLSIQQIVESAMARLVAEHKPKKAYIVMIDPKSGAVMALSQYPNFDFNDKKTITADNREFLALINGYEPGSIMKGVSLATVFDYTKLTPDSIIYCEDGLWYFAGRALREHGHTRFGDLTISQIIQKSSNIGSAKAVIENLPEPVFYNYLQAFGFGQQTRLGFYPLSKPAKFFSSESYGILKPVEKWYKIDISRIAIGHTIYVTPIQMAQAYCAIANDGEMMQPYIVDRTVSTDGIITQSVPFKKGQPITPDAARKITECLMTTVEKGGTATSAAVPGYKIAGKTGTAMKLVRSPSGKLVYTGKYNTASFIGFVPADNPAFVLLVTADEPGGRKQYGGSVCGSTFADIASETLRLLQIPPSQQADAPNQVSNQ